MTRNMGPLDRVVRAFAVAPAAIIVALIVGVGTVAGVVLFVVAGIMVASAATAVCPTYNLIGITTYPRGVHWVGRGIHHGHA